MNSKKLLRLVTVSYNCLKFSTLCYAIIQYNTYNIKTFLKMKGYISKPKKAQEQDGFDNKIKYHFHIKHHFHITTVHNYFFFVFCLYSCYIYLCRVVMWK